MIAQIKAELLKIRSTRTTMGSRWSCSSRC
jgi:hypothetical protein